MQDIKSQHSPNINLGCWHSRVRECCRSETELESKDVLGYTVRSELSEVRRDAPACDRRVPVMRYFLVSELRPTVIMRQNIQNNSVKKKRRGHVREADDACERPGEELLLRCDDSKLGL